MKSIFLTELIVMIGLVAYNGANGLDFPEALRLNSTSQPYLYIEETMLEESNTEKCDLCKSNYYSCRSWCPSESISPSKYRKCVLACKAKYSPCLTSCNIPH